MFKWMDFWQQVSGPIFLLTLGGVGTMYARMMDIGSRLRQNERDISEQDGKMAGMDSRLRAVENICTRIDTNVTAILETQKRESPGRQRSA